MLNSGSGWEFLEGVNVIGDVRGQLHQEHKVYRGHRDPQIMMHERLDRFEIIGVSGHEKSQA